MKYCLYVVLLFSIRLAAQEPAPAINTTEISDGILIDSPNVHLIWSSPLPDSSAYRNFRVRVRHKDLIVAEWDSVVLFNIPIDSIFLHYLSPNTTQWRGLHSLFLYFDPKYTDQLKAAFDRYFGCPPKSHRKRGRFAYRWYTKDYNFGGHINIWDRHTLDHSHHKGDHGHWNAYIGIAHYMQ